MAFVDRASETRKATCPIEPFDTPGKKPPPPNYYRPETTARLWEVREDRVSWTCDVRIHRESRIRSDWIGNCGVRLLFFRTCRPEVSADDTAKPVARPWQTGVFDAIATTSLTTRSRLLEDQVERRLWVTCDFQAFLFRATLCGFVLRLRFLAHGGLRLTTTSDKARVL